jgi:hypothetical protein
MSNCLKKVLSLKHWTVPNSCKELKLHIVICSSYMTYLLSPTSGDVYDYIQRKLDATEAPFSSNSEFLSLTTSPTRSTRSPHLNIDV